LLLSLSFAQAQLSGLIVSSATSLALDPSVQLPPGTFRLLGQGTASILAFVPHPSRYAHLQVYEATGLAMGLEAGYVHDLLTDFALGGYFASAPTTRTLSGGLREDIYHLQGSSGQPALLLILLEPHQIYFVVGE
jgi:hypothetical protein